MIVVKITVDVTCLKYPRSNI